MCQTERNIYDFNVNRPKGIIDKINVLNLNTSALNRFFIPVSGKASTNIIVSSPLKPDKKHIRGSDLSICNARHKMLNMCRDSNMI